MTDNIKEKIEDKIIDLINAGAGGRLVIFKPEKSDKDLVVEKRGDYKAKPISLKIYDKADFPQNEKPVQDGNFYLVFAHFDIIKQNIEDSIFIVPSLKFTGLDDISKFLVNKKDIGKFLMEALDKR